MVVRGANPAAVRGDGKVCGITGWVDFERDLAGQRAEYRVSLV